MVRTIEGGGLSAKELALLDAGEAPVFAARPSYARLAGGPPWAMPLLLLTDRRLVISKEKLLGKRRADVSAPWSQVSRVDGRLWHGGGPKIQLVVRTTVGEVELIVPPEYAVEVESAIRAGYLR